MNKRARDLQVGDVIVSRLGKSIVRRLSLEYADPFHEHLRTVHVGWWSPPGTTPFHPDQTVDVIRKVTFSA